MEQYKSSLQKGMVKKAKRTLLNYFMRLQAGQSLNLIKRFIGDEAFDNALNVNNETSNNVSIKELQYWNY